MWVSKDGLQPEQSPQTDAFGWANGHIRGKGPETGVEHRAPVALCNCDRAVSPLCAPRTSFVK